MSDRSTDELVKGLRERGRRFFDEAADRLEALQAENERLSSTIAANVTISREIMELDRTRDRSAIGPFGKAIGGSDVCITCEAHVVTFEADERYLKACDPAALAEHAARFNVPKGWSAPDACVMDRDYERLGTHYFLVDEWERIFEAAFAAALASAEENK